MVEDGQGGYRRADVSKPRLAAIKDAVALEIERQRAERKPPVRPLPGPDSVSSPATVRLALEVRVERPALGQRLQPRPLARIRAASSVAPQGSGAYRQHMGSLLTLRAVARRYSRQMQQEAEREVRRLGIERAA